MKKLFTILCLMAIVVSVFTQNAQAQIHYVTTTGAGSKDGTSWANAYEGLQAALNAATNGDQIWVAAGTYKPSVEVGGSGDRYKTFQMKNGVAIYGGFAGNETSVSQRTNYGEGQENETILSGDIGMEGDNTDNCYHVFYHPNSLGLNNTAILDGFTIKGGNADHADWEWPHTAGGGMYNDHSSSTIRNCTFTLNSAKDCGGGMYNEESSPTLTNCTFTSNSADGGGGMNIDYYSSPTITNCIFASNSAFEGGGIKIDYYSSPTITNCIFASNVAYEGGGMKNSYHSSSTITNCTFTSNSAEAGGGMFNYSSSPTINNSIIWGNTANTGGSQIYITWGGTTLNYSCYANETNDVTVNSGTFTATNNNITTDPKFVGSGEYPYLILGISPCVDAGNNTYISEEYDIRGLGHPRKLNKHTGEAGTVDMGAYEYKVGEDPLPVELSMLNAECKMNSVELRWRTATEVNNYGFEIERRSVTSDELRVTCAQWLKVGFVEGAGTSNSPKEYSFTDSKLSAGRYEYRLKQIDLNGTFKYSNSLEIEIAVPKEFALLQNYPNPFNPSTVISYQIPTVSNVTLKVYDLLGQEVATLVNEVKEAGSYEILFDASHLTTGIFFYKLTAGNFTSVKKMMVIK